MKDITLNSSMKIGTFSIGTFNIGTKINYAIIINLLPSQFSSHYSIS